MAKSAKKQKNTRGKFPTMKRVPKPESKHAKLKPVEKKNEEDKVEATSAADSSVVCLSHVPHGFYEKEMRKYFAQFGTVKQLRLSRSKKSGKSKGYAFIEFEFPEVAKVVKETMDGYLTYQKIMKCQMLPKDKVHPKLFKGSEVEFKDPWHRETSIKRHNSQIRADTERIHKAQKRRVQMERKRNDKLKKLGIDFKSDALTNEWQKFKGPIEGGKAPKKRKRPRKGSKSQDAKGKKPARKADGAPAAKKAKTSAGESTTSGDDADEAPLKRKSRRSAAPKEPLVDDEDASDDESDEDFAPGEVAAEADVSDDEDDDDAASDEEVDSDSSDVVEEEELPKTRAAAPTAPLIDEEDAADDDESDGDWSPAQLKKKNSPDGDDDDDDDDDVEELPQKRAAAPKTPLLEDGDKDDDDEDDEDWSVDTRKVKKPRKPKAAAASVILQKADTDEVISPTPTKVEKLKKVKTPAKSQMSGKKAAPTPKKAAPTPKKAAPTPKKANATPAAKSKSPKSLISPKFLRSTGKTPKKVASTPAKSKTPKTLETKPATSKMPKTPKSVATPSKSKTPSKVTRSTRKTPKSAKK